MKTTLISALILALISPFLFVSLTKADTTGGVAATVTAQQIAITVTDGGVAYGTLSLSGSASTIAGSKDDTQTATNTGNVAETFNIKGANSAAWTLNTTIGTAENYVHEFCIGTGGSPDPCDSGGSVVWTPLTTSDQEMVNEVAASGTQKFDLRVTVPDETTASVAQNVNVTVTAVAHTP